MKNSNKENDFRKSLKVQPPTESKSNGIVPALLLTAATILGIGGFAINALNNSSIGVLYDGPGNSWIILPAPSIIHDGNNIEK